jgi:putative ABC transport system substrate-binding protein
MKRRQLILALGGAALWPLAARAQQPALPVIGFLNSASPDGYADRVRAFRQGLSDTGYVEGRNVAIEYRFANNEFDRLAAFAADLIQRKVAVISANGPSALVAKAQTTTIPIVFTSGDDPVRAGLVTSLNRPNGNLTGVVSQDVELGPKRLELLHELVPNAKVFAMLLNPANRARSDILTRDLQAAARTLGLELKILQASSERDVDAVFTKLAELQVGGLVIGNDSLFISRRERLGELSAHHKVPAIFQFREFAVAGGLMAYGGGAEDAYRLAGVYTGRVLKGEKPGDLPVQQSTKAELTINLKTARALGLTVPLSLLGRADEVIE